MSIRFHPHGTLEVEVPDGATDEQIQARFQEVYALLSRNVDTEIAAAVEAAHEAERQKRFPDADAGNGAAPPDDRRRDYDDRDRGNGSGRNDDWRDRSGRRDNDNGRRDYHRPDRGQDRRDDRRDNGQRGGGNWQGRGNGNGGNGNGGNRNGAASQAQIKAIFGIAKGQGIDRRDILERIEDQFGVRRVEDLDVRQASRLIEDLKAA